MAEDNYDPAVIDAYPDALRAIAHWSQSAFSFGDLPSENSENSALKTEGKNWKSADYPCVILKFHSILNRKNLVW